MKNNIKDLIAQEKREKKVPMNITIDRELKEELEETVEGYNELNKNDKINVSMLCNTLLKYGLYKVNKKDGGKQ